MNAASLQRPLALVMLLCLLAGCSRGTNQGSLGGGGEAPALNQPDPADPQPPGDAASGRPVQQVPVPVRVVPDVRKFADWTIGETSFDALSRIGAPAVPALVDILHDRDHERRSHAARALARIGPAARDAVPDLIAALDEPDLKVRKNIIRALGQIGPAAADAVPALVDALKATK